MKDYMRGAYMLAYVTCALWSSVGEESRPLDDDYGPTDILPETLQDMRNDIAQFLWMMRPDIRAARSDGAHSLDAEQIAHDFWLTRNHHGAGFWDRGHEQFRTRLTRMAHAFSGIDLVETGDGRISA